MQTKGREANQCRIKRKNPQSLEREERKVQLELQRSDCALQENRLLTSVIKNF